MCVCLYVCVSVCVCVFLPLRPLITSGVILTLNDRLNNCNFLSVLFCIQICLIHYVLKKIVIRMLKWALGDSLEREGELLNKLGILGKHTGGGVPFLGPLTSTGVSTLPHRLLHTYHIDYHIPYLTFDPYHIDYFLLY